MNPHYKEIEIALCGLYEQTACPFDVLATWEEQNTTNYRVRDCNGGHHTARIIGGTVKLSYREDWTFSHTIKA